MLAAVLPSHCSPIFISLTIGYGRGRFTLSNLLLKSSQIVQFTLPSYIHMRYPSLPTQPEIAVEPTYKQMQILKVTRLSL